MKHLIRALSFLFTFILLQNQATAQCDPGLALVRVELQADENFAVDNTRWELLDGSGQVVLATNIDTSFCVPANDCYTFTIYDDFGNGLAGDEPGFYSLWYAEELVAAAIDFGYSQTAYLGGGCVPGSTCFSAIAVTAGDIHTVSDGEEWYVFTPTEQAVYEINTCGFGNSCNTAIWVYDRCLDLSGTDSQEETIFYNDNGCEGDQARVTGVLFPNQTYYIRVGDTGDNCAATDFQWRLQSNGPISGCTDALACNFDPLATVDDGSCVYTPHPECPLGPDLVVTPGRLKSSLRAAEVNGSECYVNEGCLQGYGQRQVVRFTTYIANIGTEDYVIGSPNPNSGQFEFDECHGHWHQEGYAEYRLYRDDGTALPVGFKNGFCVLDLDCSAGGSPSYGCSYMGISAGCADIYSSSLACQWIDVTDLPDGNYTLVVVVNWDRDPDLFGREEISYDNNWDQVCFELSRDGSGDHEITVLDDCPVYEDCAGIQQGSTQPDCFGECGGNNKHGDLNGNGFYDYGDISMYLNGILDNSLPVFACTELTGDDQITIEDPVWVNDCILLENNADGHTAHAHSCELPTIGIHNPQQTAAFTLLDHNQAEQYITVGLRNGQLEMIATHFQISGLQVSAVELATPGDNFDARVFFRPDGQVLLFSYGFDAPTRHNTFEPLVRVYYSNIIAENICLETVYSTVNKNLESVLNFIDDTNCLEGIEPCIDQGLGDSDGDGVCDDEDICPGFNDYQDTDGDGIPDGCDDCTDSDGDEVCDEEDVCPGSDDMADSDADGVPDGCDDCPGGSNEDSDGDGVCDLLDICPGGDDAVDSDGDGEPDACDACPNSATGDSDGDGICDDEDACPGSDDALDADGDGIPDACDVCPNSATGDSDGDGVCDDEDLCPGSDDTLDSDGDGTPNACDVCPNSPTDDSDEDGVCDNEDICVGVDDALLCQEFRLTIQLDNYPGETSVVLTDLNGTVVWETDEFTEGFSGMLLTYTICLPDGTYDFSIRDSFGDGICCANGEGFYEFAYAEGNVIIMEGGEFGDSESIVFESFAPLPDQDQDGVCDPADACPGFDDLIDTDADSIPDGCDVCPGFDDAVDSDGDGTPDGCDDCTDSDHDGICDDEDSCPEGDNNADADGDSVPDACDVCPGFNDNMDTDGDGIPDACDPCPNGDNDGDGVCNEDDVCPGSDDNVDTDMDGVPDGCDTGCSPPGSLSIVMIPPAVDGQYLAGQEVQVCAIVEEWSANAAGTIEWLHAMTFYFGAGWDYSSIVPNPPASCDGSGTWGWYESWVSCNTGIEYGPGFAYDSEDGVGCGGFANDGNPGNNWGDGAGGCGNIPGGSPPVIFCFDITVASCQPNVPTSDLGIDVRVWSDGDSGSWSQVGCNSGQVLETDMLGVCCGDTTVDTDMDGVPDDCDDCPNSATGDSDGDGVCDDVDICPGNDDTADADGDGEPDACDACPNSATGDSDGDGVCDDVDICPGSDDNADADADGEPDGCDACPNSATGDSDGDGVCDDVDICSGSDDTADADGDGEPDACDACPNSATGDSDGDGVCDDVDICPGSDDTADADGDGTPDGCDACPNSATGDSDGDGVCDDVDICPDSDDTADADGDGEPDGCDACPNSATGDSDGDGVCDDADICPGGDDLLDTDGDGIPNACDACPTSSMDDSDGDGVCDDIDICPGSDDTADADGDGVPDGCDACPNSATGDSDGDGVCDDVDICPGNDDNADADGDGEPDGCDACPNSATGDSDGDGVCDDVDICPGSDDTADTDGDGEPDGCDACPNSATGDSDGDGVCDDIDICPGSDDTADADADGEPDGCDACPNSATGDSDGDGVCDDVDICPGSDDTADADADGEPDGCDACPNSATGDSDGDGVCDDVDICPGSDDTADADADGEPDGCDACPNSATGDSDGDGVCDNEDICPGSDDTADADGDGEPDGCDECPNSATGDSDGDGVCDDIDICPGSDDNADADGDGEPDGCDACPNSATGDSDGDGVCDDADICPGSDDTADADDDGTPDGCDRCPGADDQQDMDGDGLPDGCDDTIDDQDQTGAGDPVTIGDLYPNPTTGLLRMGFSEEVGGSISVYDVYGRELLRYKLGGNKYFNLDASQLADGTYLVVLHQAEGYLTSRRFVKISR